MTHDGSDTPVEILLVEDNPGDIDLILDFLGDARVRNRVSVCRDGDEAMAYLRREGRFVGATRPDLILLDLNLPKKDGREVLQDVKADVRLRTIPVVVLTSSSADRDVERAYNLQANCYITKPVDLGQFGSVLRSIDDFWLSVARLPTRGGKEP
jgi:CheY-like chemotaxis protein